MHPTELRRQIFHLLYGPLLILLHARGILNLKLLFALIVIGAGTSYFIKRQRLSGVRRVLTFFERDHHLATFPGRGIFYFTLGAFLALLLFETPFAYGGIMILSVGDGLSNLVGHSFKRFKPILNPTKSLEGTLAGIVASIPAAYYFVPQFLPVVVASVVAMVLELPHIRLGRFEIDDNLIIPVAAGFTLSLLA